MLFFLFIYFNAAFVNAQIITTLAGNGFVTYGGDNGLAVLASIGLCGGITVDNTANIYFGQANNTIRRVSIADTITTLVGNGIAGFSGDNNLAFSAQINTPTAGFLATDYKGNIYIADCYNNRVRKINSISGIITTFAGSGATGAGSGNFGGDSGFATQALLNAPSYISCDFLGNVYINDYLNHRIRKVDTFGIITTIAGNGTQGFSGDNGLATLAQLNQTLGLKIDYSGNIFFIDNGRVRKINISNGIITTIAGNGIQGFGGDMGPATAAQFFVPQDVAIDKFNNLYICDRDNNRIRRIDTFGVITTVVGIGTLGYSGDNSPAINAQLNMPRALAFDLCDNLLISDNGNRRIRKVWFNTDTLPQVNATITPNDTVVTGTQVTTTSTATNHGTITSYQWVKNGANAGTNSAYTYTPVNGDSVYCIVTVRACTGRMYTDTTTAIHITVTGDAGVASTTNSTIHTYPNPVTDVLHVATTEPKHYVLHNLMGITLLQGSVEKQNIIDMKAIPAGIYLLQLTNIQGQREVVRVVKE